MIMALFVWNFERIWIIKSSSEAILTAILISTQAYELDKFSFDFYHDRQSKKWIF